MYILWSFALGMMIFVGAFWGLRVARSPDMVSDAQAEMISSVDKLRSFVWAANEYVKANPFGASVQVLTWSQIKSAPNVSPVVATQNMPSSWKVVGSSAGWVICADAAQQGGYGGCAASTGVQSKHCAAKCFWKGFCRRWRNGCRKGESGGGFMCKQLRGSAVVEMNTSMRDRASLRFIANHSDARRKGCQRSVLGFSMIEIMLGLAIMSSVLIFALRMQTSQQAAQDGIRAADTLKTFQQLAAQYFISNQAAMIAAMGASSAGDGNVQAHCVIYVTTPSAVLNPGTTPGASGGNGTLAWSGGATINDGKKSCVIDGSLMQAKGVWPSNLAVTQMDDGAGMWRYAAIFKRVRLPGPDNILGNADDVLGNDVEMLVVRIPESGTMPTLTSAQWATNRALIERTLTAMKAIGQSGGFIPIGSYGACHATKTLLQVCGQGWNIDLSQWIDPGKFSVIVWWFAKFLNVLVVLYIDDFPAEVVMRNARDGINKFVACGLVLFLAFDVFGAIFCRFHHRPSWE